MKKKKASSFYLACPLQVYLYLELIVGGETVMGGNEGAHGKIGRKECGTSRPRGGGGVHPRILDRGVPRRFVNPNTI